MVRMGKRVEPCRAQMVLRILRSRSLVLDIHGALGVSWRPRFCIVDNADSEL